jgi:hypothetical protein
MNEINPRLIRTGYFQLKYILGSLELEWVNTRKKTLVR